MTRKKNQKSKGRKFAKKKFQGEKNPLNTKQGRIAFHLGDRCETFH